MTDKTEDFERVAVTFTGLPDLLDRMHKRLAAVAGIPATRFLGTSPVGLNATGESDMANYAQHVAAMQNRHLTDPLRTLDMILARHVGLQEPPDYMWPSLFDANPTEEATTAKTHAEALQISIQSGMIDEDEGRESLNGMPVLGIWRPFRQACPSRNRCLCPARIPSPSLKRNRSLAERAQNKFSTSVESPDYRMR